MQSPVATQVEREVQIPAGGATLAGNVAVPAGACGIVLFAHGSGSGRHSPRNVFVARELQHAALVAAANFGDQISAVVSRGGRPDLAGAAALSRVTCPTLLIVGGDDDEGVIELNQRAYDVLPAEKRLTIVPGASHLFEEPGTLEEVARLASEWFGRYLGTNEAHA